MGADTVFLDLGNTRLKARASDGAALAVPADVALATASVAAWWPAGATRALLASVAPEASAAALSVALRAHGVHLRRVHSEADCAGLTLAYNDPTRFGVDRFLALLDAQQRGLAPVVLVSMGTAFTVDALDRHGQHRGGWIGVPPHLGAWAMAQRLPQLPASAAPAGPAFARDSEPAIAGGLWAQCGGAVLWAAQHLQAQAGAEVTVQVSGGDAAPLRDWLHQAAPTLRVSLRDDAVLHGLGVWWQARGC